MAIVGRANVGKSSLVNAILGEKISIVSPVAQTTRNVIRGILTEPRGQLVFQDTPGVHKAGTDLGRIMNRMARASAEGADLAMLVFDASQPPRQEDEGWIQRVLREDFAVPLVIVLNKTDSAERHDEAFRKLWSDTVASIGRAREADWICTSAANGAGVNELVDLLFQRLPEGPNLFPDDVLTDYPRKLAIADVIREKLFHVLHEELPHAIAVWVEHLDEVEDRWDVKAYIYVNKHSQKGIVIGEKGRLLRKVTRQSEAELKSMYDKTVSLKLWVKVEEDWSRNFWLLKKFGYA